LTRDEVSLSYRAVDKLHPDAGLSTSYQLRTGRGSARLEAI
jgi:alkaline phosphatase D